MQDAWRNHSPTLDERALDIAVLGVNAGVVQCRDAVGEECDMLPVASGQWKWASIMTKPVCVDIEESRCDDACNVD